jgi:uncharacterized membrane protein YhhN
MVAIGFFVGLVLVHFIFRFIEVQNKVFLVGAKMSPVIFAFGYSIYNSIKFQSFYGVLISIGLFLSLTADGLLEYDKFFLFGVGAFALAHLFYIFAFSKYGVNWIPFLITLGILTVVGVIYFNFLKSGLGDMTIPVIAYIGIITLMVSFAVSTGFSNISSLRKILIISGAVLFYISDAELAYSMFYKEIPNNWFFNGIFYYTAQMLLAQSIVE